MEISYLIYPNANLVPAMIVYGAFLVPVVFMVHLYERLEATELPVTVILICFISAGSVGVALASTVEIATFQSFGPFALIFVGPIEETAKMIVPLVFFALGSYRSVGAGVMLGLTSAMAFSALETAGYGFNAFLGTLTGDGSERIAGLFKNPINILSLDASVIFRSLLDPVGHGTWTMLVCFVLFNECREAGRFVLNGRVIVTFALACVLHSSWDTTLSVPNDPAWGKTLAWVGFVATASFTLWLMKRIIKKTREVMSATLQPPRQSDQENLAGETAP